MSRKEPGHPDLNRKEKNLLVMLLSAVSELSSGRKVLRDRLNLVDPRANGYLACALGLIRRVRDTVYATAPTRQKQYIDRMTREGGIVFCIDRTLLPKGYVSLSNDDVNVLAEAATRDRCSLCLLDARDSKNCPLRNVLLDVWPPNKVPRYGGCPYKDVIFDTDATKAIAESEED